MLLVLVVLVVAALLVGDRVAHGYAEKKIAAELGSQDVFTTAPDVTVGGYPFLTQVVAGRYDHVTVDGSGLTLGEIRDVRFHADLRGVHVPLSDVVQGKVRSVPIDSASGTVVITYAEFARQTAIKGLTITEKNGALTVTAPVDVDVAFIHETFDVVAEGTVAADGNDLDLSVDHIEVAGVSLPGVAVDVISDYLNNSVSLPKLPYGLQLRAVTSEADGLHVAVAGTGLTVRAR